MENKNERFNKLINAIITVTGLAIVFSVYSFTQINNAESGRTESLRVDEDGITISSQSNVANEIEENNQN